MLLKPFERLSLLDALSIMLVAIATGLGASVGILAPLLPLAAPQATLAVVGVAIMIASLAALIQGVSTNRLADDVETGPNEEEEGIQERWHREQVQRAYNQGYSEGRYHGYESGIEKGLELAKQASDEMDQTTSSQVRPTEDELSEPSVKKEYEERQENEQGLSEDIAEPTEKKDSTDEAEPSEEEIDTEGQKNPEIEERLNELESELEEDYN
ncbi:hypothetical protein [Haloferax profundi]|nr:hypothetical protein [Haloferax profundi]